MPVIVPADITPATIAVELGRPSPATDSVVWSQWARWIEDAKFLIRARLGDLSTLDQEALSYVIRQAVAAHVRRPDDSTQLDIAVDDGRVSRRWASSAGKVVITDDLWDLLTPVGSETSGAFSISPAGSVDRYGDSWQDTDRWRAR